MPAIDPTQLHALNDQLKEWASDDETIYPVTIKQLSIDDQGIDVLTDTAAGYARNGRTLLVTDRTAMTRQGHDLKQTVQNALSNACATTTLCLDADAEHELHADLDEVHKLQPIVADYDLVVSVGSGTVTDIVKYARHLAARETGKPVAFTCFPTAASVTAYTSALAVISVDGAKRTLASLPPDAVICDLPTLAEAPFLMTAAGFGDVLARSVAYGDWYIAYELGMADTFSLVPGQLLQHAEQHMIDQADSIAHSRSDGIRALIEAVLLAGMSMSIVNETAPISGWEHVISHYLDMTAHTDQRPIGLHGGQVGVGTLIAGRAYERVWPALDLDRLQADIDQQQQQSDLQTIKTLFEKCDPTGAMIKEIWRDYSKKVDRWNAASQQRARFIARKRDGSLDPFISKSVRSSRAIAEALSNASAPSRFADLDAPIPDHTAVQAVQFSHMIRARFTLGDLLDRSGWLDRQRAEELLAS